MAEAIFNKLSEKNKAFSRGIGANTHSHAALNAIPGTTKVMKEIGVGIRTAPGRAVTRKDVTKADMVIVLLDKKQRHILPKYITVSPKTRYYGIVDSDARTKEFLNQQRRNRDIVRKFISKLVKNIG